MSAAVYDIDFDRFAKGKPPVVLLGGLNLARALGLARIPVIVASSDPDDPVFASRHCRGTCRLPPLDRPDAVVEMLLEIAEKLSSRLGRNVPLMYGNDDYLDLIYAHRDRLQSRFLLLLNDPEIGQALIEKSRFAALARARKLPVPQSLRWDGDAPDAVQMARGPVLVKPRSKADWHDSPLHELLFTDDGKALVFDNGPAACAHPLVERYRNQLEFQEFIPGDDSHLWSFHGFSDERGQLIASFVGRKVRTYPPITGESACIEMVRDAGFSIFGRTVAERVPLKGPFKIDFKMDPRDGRLLILEVNARYNLWHYLGATNGVNLPEVAYEYLVNKRRLQVATYQTDKRWVYLRLDYHAYRALAKRGEISLGSWIASLLSQPLVGNILAWDDPMPYAAVWVGRLTRRARRAAERLTTLVRQWLSTAS